MNAQHSSMNDQLAGASIRPLLIRLSIPATIAQLVNALYSIVDRVFIGHMPDIGRLALSGVGLTFPIIMLVSAFSCLPGAGGAPLASIAIGKGDLAKAQKILGSSASLLLLISFVLTFGCLPFLTPLLTWFGADTVTMPYAYEYLQVYLIGTVFVELSLGLNYFINAQGFTLTATLSVVIGASLNILLDPLFLYVFDMGVRGAAVATVISQFLLLLNVFITNLLYQTDIPFTAFEQGRYYIPVEGSIGWLFYQTGPLTAEVGYSVMMAFYMALLAALTVGIHMIVPLRNLYLAFLVPLIALHAANFALQTLLPIQCVPSVFLQPKASTALATAPTPGNVITGFLVLLVICLGVLALGLYRSRDTL